MTARNWRRHASHLVIGLTIVLLAGWLSGEPVLVLAVASFCYLAWTVANVYRLYQWLRSEEGKIPESLGMWADIFDRIHELQKSNRQQQEKHQSVIQEFLSMTDAFPDATLVIDQNDCLTWFNDAAHNLLGLQVPEDLGQPVTNLLRDPDFADWIAVGEQVQTSFEMASPADSTVRLDVSIITYREKQRLLVLRDVTEINNLEKIRRDFVANVSHELRTPLTVLLGYLESISDQCPDDVTPVISKMQDQARQMQGLLSDLLELSRLQSAGQVSEDQIVDVPAILMQLKEQSEELSQGRHTLKFAIEPAMFLLGNAVDLESAFRNLINNAIKYTADGGEVAVRWESTEEGPTFSVRDTGIGIPTRDIPRLTERFYRVGSDRSRDSGGTGLGLSIVKHVLNAHEAYLNIDSELGLGSTFSCVFPVERTARPKNARSEG
ncbi:MAG: phosphate regulon sensor histidine kinase PhoR [Lysobacterales bacterium]